MKTGRTDHVDIDRLTAWFSEAAPGAWFVYAVGDLANDRGVSFHGVPTTMLDVVGLRVMDWERKGYVFLFQWRVGFERFAYLVQRRAAADVFERERIVRERAAIAMRLGLVA